MLLAHAQTWALSLAATAPTPGEELPFNPDDVTPGPLGFFVFIFVAVATGLLVMDLIRRTSRVQARARIREQLQAEVAANAAAATEVPAEGAAGVPDESSPTTDGGVAPDSKKPSDEARKAAD
ncbi:hypothetical protein C5B85_01330 [Pseudoclavibacter sp. AY1F1]|uniref:hypothetical protein n=1 Tax=Pseudoclavibacter sp. AY1F1 TaxID=2080583 RepID=UPI000CE81A33|nr:hypothetical protein [Pseudoclavibacter sp. AY1F1]PPF46951.1 hypothetical protein C5B85_01330 [Pseudoclavibacter sp. AY1F1]